VPVIEVKPSGSPSYEVIVETGALSRVNERVPRGSTRLVVISDSNVARIYGEDVRASLRGEGRSVELLSFPAGEDSKDRRTKAVLEDEMLARGVGRDAVIVALGGGVTTDLVGFVAATYLRGIRYISVPTSLLAMVDASIGGKTGVNHPRGKNLIGCFHQPAAVVIDPETLTSLPPGQLDCGLAEMLKHALIAGPGALGELTRDPSRIKSGDPSTMAELICRSAEIKAAVVGRDECESGERAVLNLGHTIGHAVENASGYAVPHGHAVSIGLLAEARIAHRIGVLDRGSVLEIERALDVLGLPDRLPAGVEPAAVVEATGSDKKTRDGAVRYALLAGIGVPARGPDGWTHEVPRDVVTRVLEGMR
jgi:3-dehydroquinate synthase